MVSGADVSLPVGEGAIAPVGRAVGCGDFLRISRQRVDRRGGSIAGLTVPHGRLDGSATPVRRGIKRGKGRKCVAIACKFPWNAKIVHKGVDRSGGPLYKAPPDCNRGRHGDGNAETKCRKKVDERVKVKVDTAPRSTEKRGSASETRKSSCLIRDSQSKVGNEKRRERKKEIDAVKRVF
jgi:hypothetical protein